MQRTSISPTQVISTDADNSKAAKSLLFGGKNSKKAINERLVKRMPTQLTIIKPIFDKYEGKMSSNSSITPTEEFEFKYDLNLKNLGTGSSSVVYECTVRNEFDSPCLSNADEVQDDPEVHLCVKVTKLADEAQVAACENEYRILKSLNHPAIVKCYDFYPDLINNQCMTVLQRIYG